MSHFAKIDENNIVTQVIVAEQAHIDTLPDSDKWIQTSYNTGKGKHYKPNSGIEYNGREEDDGTPLRKNFAGSVLHMILAEMLSSHRSHMLVGH